jgi:hypothetical protein
MTLHFTTQLRHPGLTQPVCWSVRLLRGLFKGRKTALWRFWGITMAFRSEPHLLGQLMIYAKASQKLSQSTFASFLEAAHV